MGLPVDELLSRISSKELTEWMAYDSVEPIGEFRNDIRTGMIAAAIANTSRDAKRKPEPFSPEDFIIDFWKREDTVDSGDNWKANLLLAEFITTAMGGKDNRSGYGNSIDVSN